MSTCTRVFIKWLTVFLICLAAQLVSYGQTSRYPCGNGSLNWVTSQNTRATNSAAVSALSAHQLTMALEDTTTYIVPVVFIIYHVGEPVGSGSNIADAAVQYMLDIINERYAGIGVDQYRGLDSKIRFKLAKRTQACNPTTGIIRVDGRRVPGYEANGLSEYSMQAKLAALVPDFTDRFLRSGVMVINVCNRVDVGAFAYYGGAVYLSAPTQADLNPYNYVPPHEVGHSLNLIHTYEGSYQQGDGYSCPTDTYNDQVEDTQPTRALDPYRACEPGAEQFINSCTGLPFGSQLHNLMSFGCDQDRFTPGQIARMRYFLANDFNQLVTSDFHKPLDPSEAPIPVACALTVPPANDALMYGISSFEFNTINYQSGIYSSRYADYSCSYRTQAMLGQTLPLRVTGYGTFGRVYIDYNSDGLFDESAELVMDFTTNDITDQPMTFSQSVTIPTTAVVNRILHVRVIFDNGNTPPSACTLPGRANQGFGEVEDYGLLVVAPSCQSVRSGNWNDATIWSCGQVPLAQSEVIIEAAHTVFLDEKMPQAVCRSLDIRGTFSMQGGSVVIDGNRISLDETNVITH